MLSRSRKLLDSIITKLQNNLGVSGSEHLQSKPQIPSAPNQPPIPPIPHQQEKKEILEQKKIDFSQAPYDLFKMIDIRAGDMVQCWLHPSSTYLYCQRINIGEPSVREIGSGLQQNIPIQRMKGPVFVMANLKPRKLGGFNSNGMVLAVHIADSFDLLIPPEGMPVGERVGVEGEFSFESSPLLPKLNPKKKILEKCVDFLHTDEEGYACFGEKKLITSQGYIKTKYANSSIS